MRHDPEPRVVLAEPEKLSGEFGGEQLGTLCGPVIMRGEFGGVDASVDSDEGDCHGRTREGELELCAKPIEHHPRNQVVEPGIA